MAFEGLFYGLRARGVPVAMDEWLGLQEALARGLADSSLSRFYLLARALLVKSERHYDDYDLAFAEYLTGLEQSRRRDRRPGVGVAGRAARRASP